MSTRHLCALPFDMSNSKGGQAMQEERQLSVDKAAKMMRVTPLFLRYALQQNKFPFGVAVDMGKSWRYYINEERFRKWLKGELVCVSLTKQGIGTDD